MKITFTSPYRDLAEKYNIPFSVTRKIKHPYPVEIVVATFHVYDSSNPEDKELILMNDFLKKNPSCKKSYWQQSGPCSNWGYDILRMENEEEYSLRIKKEIQRWSKKV